jgi:hypothetical protein
MCLAAVIIFGATGTVGRQMLDFIVKQDVMGSDVKVCVCQHRGYIVACMQGAGTVLL